MTILRSLSLGVAALLGCATTTIDSGQIERITVQTSEPRVIEGAELRTLLRHTRCQSGNMPWDGGHPAELVLSDGEIVAIDGFSAEGRFFRIDRKQWCEVEEDAWRQVFGN